MTIKRFIKEGGFSDEYNFNYTSTLEVTPESLTFTTIPNVENKELNINRNNYTTSLSFSDLKSRVDSGGLDRWIVEINKKGEHEQIKNLYAETAITKIEGIEYAIQKNVPSIFHVIVKPEDTSFEDASIFIYLNVASTITCNKEIQIVEKVRTPRNQKSYLPVYELTKASDNENESLIRINTPTNVNQTFYVKSDIGVVPSQFKVSNGIGEFLFSKIGMKDGDVATIKVGLKYFSNLISIEVNK